MSRPFEVTTDPGRDVDRRTAHRLYAEPHEHRAQVPPIRVPGQTVDRRGNQGATTPIIGRVRVCGPHGWSVSEQALKVLRVDFAADAGKHHRREPTADGAKRADLALADVLQSLGFEAERRVDHGNGGAMGVAITGVPASRSDMTRKVLRLLAPYIAPTTFLFKQNGSVTHVTVDRRSARFGASPQIRRGHLG